MTTPSFRSGPLLLGLLGFGLSAGAVLANPYDPASHWHAGPWPGNPGPQLGWVQAQRAWADRSYRQTQRRLDQLEQCLSWARQRWELDRCLRRDQLAREQQWQDEQQEWQRVLRRHDAIARQPWQPAD